MAVSQDFLFTINLPLALTAEEAYQVWRTGGEPVPVEWGVRRIYLDAGMLPLLCCQRCWRRCAHFCLERFGNASSIHQEGQHARSAVEQARASVARLLSCRPAEIVFTSGGTESDNLAIFGSVQAGDHVITSAVEHHAVLHAVERLRERGVEVEFLPVDEQGVLAAEDVRKALRPNTKLISVMMANNETGVLQPVGQIGQIAAEAGRAVSCGCGSGCGEGSVGGG